MSPFIQFATLPIANGGYDKAMAVLEPLTDFIKRDVPGCRELSVYKSQDSETHAISIILFERYVLVVHRAFCSCPGKLSSPSF